MSPSGAAPGARPRSRIDLRGVNPHIVEVAIRLLALAGLLALVILAAFLGSHAGA